MDFLCAQIEIPLSGYFSEDVWAFWHPLRRKSPSRDLNVALRACQEIRFGETYINHENFEAMQCFHAGWRKSRIGGADGKQNLYEFTQTHVVYMQ